MKFCLFFKKFMEKNSGFLEYPTIDFWRETGIIRSISKEILVSGVLAGVSFFDMLAAAWGTTVLE